MKVKAKNVRHPTQYEQLESGHENLKTTWHSLFHIVARENYDWGSLRIVGEDRLEMGRDGAEGVYEVMFDAAELDA